MRLTCCRAVPVLYWRPELFTAFKFLAFFAIPLFFIDVANEYRDEEYLFENASDVSRIGIAVVLLIALTLFSGNNISAFIYFQF